MLTSLLLIADSVLMARILTTRTLWSPWSLYFLFTAIRIVMFSFHMPQTAVFMTMLALVFQLYCTQDVVQRMWRWLPQPILFVWLISAGVGGLLLIVHNPYPAYPAVLYYTHACLQLAMFSAVIIAMFSYQLMGGTLEREVLWQGILWMVYMAGCLVSDIVSSPSYAPMATNATGVVHLFYFAGWFWNDLHNTRSV